MKQKTTTARARRQRIPAFGEWNDVYGYGGAGAGDDTPAVVTQYYYDSAVHMQVQLQAGRLAVEIPPPSPRKPANNNNKVVKWRDSATATLELDDEKKQKQQQHVMHQPGHAYNYKQACRVVKAMDQDLYHIPPDMLCHDHPRKRLTRSRRRSGLWMGCLGRLNCVVA